jgi:hypothetical protein
MPMLATAILGIAGQAVWKLATYLYDRFTAPSAPAAGASTTPTTSFASSLADATSTAASAATQASGLLASAPQDPVTVSDVGGVLFTARKAALANVADLYRRMAEVQAP